MIQLYNIVILKAVQQIILKYKLNRYKAYLYKYQFQFVSIKLVATTAKLAITYFKYNKC